MCPKYVKYAKYGIWRMYLGEPNMTYEVNSILHCVLSREFKVFNMIYGCLLS